MKEVAQCHYAVHRQECDRHLQSTLDILRGEGTEDAYSRSMMPSNKADSRVSVVCLGRSDKILALESWHLGLTNPEP